MCNALSRDEKLNVSKTLCPSHMSSPSHLRIRSSVLTQPTLFVAFSRSFKSIDEDDHFLSFSYEGYGDEEASMIMQALENNTTVNTLYMSSMCFGHMTHAIHPNMKHPFTPLLHTQTSLS